MAAGIRRWGRSLLVLFVLLAFLAVSDAGAQPEGPTSYINGCRNGASGVGPCEGGAWVTGSISAPQALYRMGDFAPYRLVLARLGPNREYTIRISYTAMKGTYNGFDYLGSYSASVQPRGLLASVTPCSGVGETAGAHSCTSGNPDTQAIPPDLETTFPTNTPAAHPPNTHPPLSGTQHFTLWGGSFNGASTYFYGCATCLPIGPTTRADREREINITFTTPATCPGGPPVEGSCTALLAWSGHIASARDWGFGRTYAELGGGTAGFHMKPIHAVVDGTTYPLSGEVPLSVTATGRLVGFTTHATPTEVLVQGPGGPGEPVTDRATLFGHSSSPLRPVTGQVRFFVCGPTASSTPCSAGGTDLGAVELGRLGTSTNAEATSPEFTPTAPGTYCFRVEYEPNDTAFYSPRVHTAVTNECFLAVAARIRVTKLCNPTTDPGHFNILFNGAQLGEPDVACGGSRPATGHFNTTAGTHTVGEAAGTGTNLTDYTTSFGGNCAGGSITLALGEVATCEITNTRTTPPPPTASLTVNKACVPATDPGRFEIRIDGAPVADLSCGAAMAAPIELSTGAHTVSEVAVPPTSLSDYTSAISGNCAADGSITLAPGQAASCTITNTRATTPPPTTTLRVDKVCVPAGGRGHFNLTINGAVAGTGGNVNCHGTTGVVPLTPGAHTVGETGASGTALARYRVVIGGDCAANGMITVATGQQATCLITNVLRAVLRPPALCPTLTVTGRRMVNTGTSIRVLARVHVRGRPLEAVHVFAVGPGVFAVRRTGPTGHALFVLNLRRPGILTLRILRAFGCPKPHPHRIGILGVSQPSLTG